MRLSQIQVSTEPNLPSIPHANLYFQGHWFSPSDFPDSSLIYVVHASRRNILLPNLISIRAPIYIGQSGDGEARHENHERAKDWPSYLQSGEVLTFTWAHVAPHLRDQVEAALIYENQPLANEALKGAYTKQPIFVHSRGEVATLKRDIFVSSLSGILKRMDNKANKAFRNRLLGLRWMR